VLIAPRTAYSEGCQFVPRLSDALHDGFLHLECDRHAGGPTEARKLLKGLPEGHSGRPPAIGAMPPPDNPLTFVADDLLTATRRRPVLFGAPEIHCSLAG
jgi:hypothetical protein